MSIRFIPKLIGSCAIFGLLVCFHAARASQVREAPPPAQPSGAELYKQHCATCHGVDLRGTGPIPSPYRVPPNLTTLARRNGGKFPDAYVAKVLRNGVILPEHGPAEMPVWGTVFRAAGGMDATQIADRIAKLTSYIKSLQAK